MLIILTTSSKDKKKRTGLDFASKNSFKTSTAYKFWLVLLQFG